MAASVDITHLKSNVATCYRLPEHPVKSLAIGNMVSCSLLLLIFTSIFHLVQGSDWDYSIASETGPDNWNQVYPECSGSNQSPIDIDRSAVRFSSSLISFEVPGYETIPRGAHWQLKNNGRSIELLLSGDYIVKEGGLVDEFKAVRLDFHWGPTDKTGSEHHINGSAYPLELQIVHYNTKYGSYEEAYSRNDGLAIFVFLFKISERDNSMYTQLINNLKSITKEGDEVTLRPVPLLSLLPLNLNNYYRYQGSLTTPPCSESVMWTVFHEFVDMSSRQMSVFRSAIQSRAGFNSRPLMSLNDRRVYSSNIDDATWLTAPLSPVSITLAALLGFVILFLILHLQQRRQLALEEQMYQTIYEESDLLNDRDTHLD